MISLIFFLLFSFLYTYVTNIQAPIVSTQETSSPLDPQSSVKNSIEKQAEILIDTTINAVQQPDISTLFQTTLQQLDNRAQDVLNSLVKAPESLSKQATNFTTLYTALQRFSDQEIERFERDAQDIIVDAVIKLDNLDIAKNFRDLNKEEFFEGTIINEFAKSLQEHTHFLLQKLNEFAVQLLKVPLLPNNLSLTDAYIDERQKAIGAPTFEKEKIQKSDFWNSAKQYALSFGQKFGSLLQDQVKDTAKEFSENAVKALHDQFKETRNQVKEALTNKALRSLGIEPTKKPAQTDDQEPEEEVEQVKQLEELSQELDPQAEQEENRVQFELVNNNKNTPIELYYLGNIQTNLLTNDKEFLLQGYSALFPGGHLEIEYPATFKNDEPIILVLRINTSNFQRFKYFIFNPEKTIFIEINNENKNLIPAQDKDGDGLTESGLSLKNNVTISDIKESLSPDKRPLLFNDYKDAIKQARERASRLY